MAYYIGLMKNAFSYVYEKLAFSYVYEKLHAVFNYLTGKQQKIQIGEPERTVVLFKRANIKTKDRKVRGENEPYPLPPGYVKVDWKKGGKKEEKKE